MPSAIVTTHYRYKRPPRKKKPIVLTGSAIVRRVKAGNDTRSAEQPSAIVTTLKPSKLRGEPVSPDGRETGDFEATTAHFRAVLASKLKGRPMADGLPTARTTLRTGCVRMLMFCNSCHHQAKADLQALRKNLANFFAGIGAALGVRSC